MVSALGGGDEVASLLEALATLHAHGVAVDWRAVLPAGPRAQLPGYPFQRQAYWRSASARPATMEGGLLGREIEPPPARRLFAATLRSEERRVGKEGVRT